MGNTGKTTNKNHTTAEEIVDKAVEVLAEVGFARFSGLQVAKAAGIRQSLLTYYFPTREDLHAAMSQHVTKIYSDMIEQLCLNAEAQGSDPFAHIIDSLILDAVSPPTSILFPALWEAAIMDVNMSSALDTIYHSSQKRMIQMLDVDPAKPEAESLWKIVRVLGVIIEGCTAIYGREPKDNPQITELRETVKTLLLPAFQQALVNIRKAQ